MIAIVLLAAAQVAPSDTVETSRSGGQIIPAVAIELQGEVSTRCEATGISGAIPSLINVDLGVLSDTPEGVEAPTPSGLAFRYICNSANGFTRILSSQNSGFLVRDGTSGGPGNAIRYFVVGEGDNGLDIPRTQLVSPLTTSVAGSPTMLAGIDGVLNLRVEGVRRFGPQGIASTSIFAGDYRDTLTLAVTAN